MAKVEQFNPLSDFPTQAPEPIKKEGRCCGHRVKVIKEKIGTFFIDLFHAIGDAFNRRSPFGKILKLSIHVLTGIGHGAGGAFRGAGLLKALSVADTVNDSFDIAVDAHEIIEDASQHVEKKDPHKAKKKAHKCDIISHIAFFVADIGGLVLWLDELALISLAKISASIGKGFSRLASALGPGFAKFTNAVVRTFPFVAKVGAKFTLLNVVRGVVVGAFLALSIKECGNLIKAIRERNIQKIVNSSLYLISFIAEIALKILAIAGCATVPGLVIVGCLAAGFGLAAFFMEVIREYREERAKAAQRKVPPPPVIQIQQPPQLELQVA